MFSKHLRDMAACILLTMFLMPCASAQETGAIPDRLTIPDGTPIKLRLGESVSSAHARPGDRLDFVVVRNVNVGGFTVIPAGTVARGSVTEVKHKRFLGIGGDVALKLDSVELVNGDRVGLRAHMNVKGRSRTKLMAAAMVATGLIFLPATPVFLLTRGHDSTVVKSTEITAQIDGADSIVTTGLQPSRESSSELGLMMDYLPPRVFSGEGREGDMVNLVLVGQQDDVQKAFQRAGWVRTDKWTPLFVWHLLRYRTSDALLPMARFYLYGRVQDYSYALPDPGAVMSRRHHLRIWKTDYKIDGTPIWTAAATHDVAIEIAKGGHLINHRIDPAVDAERDFVGSNLTETLSVDRQEYLHSVDPVFEAKTEAGEDYHSDSRILLLDLHSIASTGTGVAGQPSTVVRATALPAPVPAESLQNNLTAHSF
ncbi:MAG: LssY C-terminal domain-containing protein [Candidatus Korobacteraceae bacterium]